MASRHIIVNARVAIGAEKADGRYGAQIVHGTGEQKMAKTEMPQYASWLEGFVKRLFEDSGTVNGIAVAIVGNDNTIETGYWECTMADKLLIAGIIQQDAMLQTLAANADDDGSEEEDGT